MLQVWKKPANLGWNNLKMDVVSIKACLHLSKITKSISGDFRIRTLRRKNMLFITLRRDFPLLQVWECEPYMFPLMTPRSRKRQMGGYKLIRKFRRSPFQSGEPPAVDVFPPLRWPQHTSTIPNWNPLTPFKTSKNNLSKPGSFQTPYIHI